MNHQDTRTRQGRVAICTFAALVLASSALAVGETGAQFLKIGVGARACGMGEAFVGVADDVTALYWNPAGLVRAGSIEVLAMQNFWLLDMSYQYAAGAFKTPVGSIGVSGAYSSSGKMPKYENFQKVGEYTAYDIAATLGYANKVGPVAVGVGGKYIQQQIEEEKASGFAADAGVHYQLPIPIVKTGIGLAVQNFGTPMKFIEQADPLPFNIVLGASVGLGPALVAADVAQPADGDVTFKAGAELTLLDVLALRAGYNTANSFTAGAGVEWMMVAVDYAFVPYTEVDGTHRISARVRF